MDGVDGVQAPSVVKVSGTRTGNLLTVSGEPAPGEMVHVACRVIGVRQDGPQRVAIVEPVEVTG